MSSCNKILNLDSVSPGVRKMGGVRGAQMMRAKELQKELTEGVIHPFTEVMVADIGDAQAMGQKPVTFIRQVTSLCLDTNTLSNDPKIPKDVADRAKQLLQSVPAKCIGVYSGETGIPLVRQHVAEYIQQRDGGIPSDPAHIILSNGASGAIMNVLSLFADEVDGQKCGVLVPVPQYPLYSNAIAQFGLHKLNYYLEEETDWSLDISELENVVNSAKSVCKPRVLVVINPGNPTGQVLTRECIEEIVKFAYREQLYILADEVYQHNIFHPERLPFHSFKKVMTEMGAPYSSMELASFMSVSKGYAGECGLRGGYVELFNASPEIMQLFQVILQTQLCPSAIGQVAMDCVVKEPAPGDASYAQFTKEKRDILDSLKRRSDLVSKALNSFKRVTCNPVVGALYAFAQLHLPERAVEEARKRKMEPDGFYVMELLNATGICVGPGYVFGQKPGTYHLRMTILPQEERMRICMKKFKEFNDAFMTKYE